MATSIPLVTSNDRLTFTLIIAAAIHALLVFAISFGLTDINSNIPQTLEVTLAFHKSTEKVEEADYLAQVDQQGSGTLEDKALPSTTEQSVFQDNNIRKANPVEKEATAPIKPTEEKPVVTTIAEADRTTQGKKFEEKLPNQTKEGPTQTLLERSVEIASLEAQLAWQRELYAKRPRIHRLTAASTMSAVDASYVDAWARKIEKVGNVNYPQEALQKHLGGDVRVMVSLLPNGTVKEIEILKPSGYKVLNDAVKSIVRLASPFAPFPEEVRKERDVLEIIRTWSFRNNFLSSS